MHVDRVREQAQLFEDLLQPDSIVQRMAAEEEDVAVDAAQEEASSAQGGKKRFEVKKVSLSCRRRHRFSPFYSGMP